MAYICIRFPTSVPDLLTHPGVHPSGTSTRPSGAPDHLNGFRFDASTTTGGLNNDLHAPGMDSTARR